MCRLKSYQWFRKILLVRMSQLHTCEQLQSHSLEYPVNWVVPNSCVCPNSSNCVHWLWCVFRLFLSQYVYSSILDDFQAHHRLVALASIHRLSKLFPKRMQFPYEYLFFFTDVISFLNSNQPVLSTVFDFYFETNTKRILCQSTTQFRWQSQTLNSKKNKNY